MTTTITSIDPERSSCSSEMTSSLAAPTLSVFPNASRLRNLLLKAVLVGGTVLVGGGASAEIQVSAFEKAKGFHSIMSGDLDQAKRALPAFADSHLDYADTNNLCVLQILQKNQSDALQSCKKALSKASRSSMKRTARRSARAGIYANLAAAQILDGQYAEARYSLDRALSLSKTGELAESNALQNERVLQSRMLAAN